MAEISTVSAKPDDNVCNVLSAFSQHLKQSVYRTNHP